MDITFDSASGGSCGCDSKALASVNAQSYATIASGAGATATAVYTGVAGDKAVRGGKLVFGGGACVAYKVTYQEVIGDDCNNCTNPDTLSLGTAYDVILPAGLKTIDVPDAFIASVKVTTGTITAGVFTASNVASDTTVGFISSRAGRCSEVLVP